MNNSNISYDYDICYRKIETSWVPAAMEYLLGVAGNFIALILLWINRDNHKWSTFYKLFAGLAITDFLGIFLVYPLVMKRYASNFTWCYSRSLCQYVSFILVTAHLSSALFICAMTIDRYLNIAHQSLSYIYDKGKTYTFTVIGIWTFAGLISMLHLVGVGESQLFFPGSWCYFNFVSNSSGNITMSYLYSIIGFLIMFVTITLNVINVYRMCRDPIESGVMLDSKRLPILPDQHVVVFLIAIIMAFFILWTPLLVDIFLHAVQKTRANGDIELWLLRMAVCNTIVNPWLYIVFRKESIEIYKRLCRTSNKETWKRGNEETYNEETERLRDVVNYVPDPE